MIVRAFHVSEFNRLMHDTLHRGEDPHGDRPTAAQRRGRSHALISAFPATQAAPRRSPATQAAQNSPQGTLRECSRAVGSGRLVPVGRPGRRRSDVHEPTPEPATDPRLHRDLAVAVGLIVPVGAWVMGEACRQARSWRERFPDHPHFDVMVNVSARRLVQSDFLDVLSRTASTTGTHASSLCLEVTEETLHYDLDAAWACSATPRSSACGVPQPPPSPCPQGGSTAPWSGPRPHRRRRQPPPASICPSEWEAAAPAFPGRWARCELLEHIRLLGSLS